MAAARAGAVTDASAAAQAQASPDDELRIYYHVRPSVLSTSPGNTFAANLEQDPNSVNDSDDDDNDNRAPAISSTLPGNAFAANQELEQDPNWLNDSDDDDDDTIRRLVAPAVVAPDNNADVGLVGLLKS